MSVTRFRILIAAGAVLWMIGSVPSAGAGEVEDVVERETGEPRPVYRLNEPEAARLLQAFRSWVEDHMDLARAERTEDRPGKWTGWKLEMRSNEPIPSSEGPAKGLSAEEPFNVFYIEEPGQRIFRKALWVPTKNQRTGDEVLAIGRAYLERLGFIRSTGRDRIHGGSVLSWRYKLLDGASEQTPTLTLQQRATFSREFDDLEVINSSHAVDLHPETLEVLGLTSILWSPIDEDSGEVRPYLDADRIFELIDDAFVSDEPDLKVGLSAEPAWYQAEKHLLPVLVVTAELETPSEDRCHLDPVVISLVDGLPLESDDDELDRPSMVEEGRAE